MADASHELRSPLTSIRSELEIDLEHQESADWRETHRRVLEDSQDLERLVDDLLFLARNEAGVEPAMIPTDLDDIVLTEVERGRELASVTFDVSSVSAGQMAGDPAQLRRLVRNLLDNAAVHAEATVRVRLVEEGEIVELTVEDDGPGIPAADRHRVFDRFTQLDEARTRDRTGAGLGLAIVKGIVTRHGGSIELDEGEAGGARVVVHLPRATA